MIRKRYLILNGRRYWKTRFQSIFEATQFIRGRNTKLVVIDGDTGEIVFQNY